MSNPSIIDEVQKIESTIKEEIGKTAMLLRDQFHQQLSMERQDRQNLGNQLRMDLQAQRAVIRKVEEQLAVQQATYEKLQQQLMDSSNASAANTALSELQTSLEKVQQEAARQSAVQQDILQQQAVAVDLHLEGGLQDDQIQELRRDFNAQRTYLSEQSSKFTTLVAEGEETKLKLRVVESLLDETRVSLSQKVMATQGAPAVEDHSMQSELHSHFVGLKETVAQLRTDFAVQASMHQDLLVQRAGLQQGLESLRQDVNTLKLCSTTASSTMSMGLPDIVQTLRSEFEQKVTSLEQKTQAVLAMSTGDNADRAERMNKLVEASPSTNTNLDRVVNARRLNSAVQQGNPAVKEPDSIASLKHMDMSLSSSAPSAGASTSDIASDTVQVGADAARREPVEEVSPGSLTFVAPQSSNRPDGEERQPEFLSQDLKLALNSLVDRIHDTVKADPTNARSKSPMSQRSKSIKESASTSSHVHSQSRSLALPQKGRSEPASIAENTKALRGRLPEAGNTSGGRIQIPGYSASVSVQRTVSTMSPTRAGSMSACVGESGQYQPVPRTRPGGTSPEPSVVRQTSLSQQRLPESAPSGIANRTAIYPSNSWGRAPSKAAAGATRQPAGSSPSPPPRPGFPFVPGIHSKVQN